jgi:hypothetical protein
MEVRRQLKINPTLAADAVIDPVSSKRLYYPFKTNSMAQGPHKVLTFALEKTHRPITFPALTRSFKRVDCFKLLNQCGKKKQDKYSSIQNYIALWTCQYLTKGNQGET